MRRGFDWPALMRAGLQGLQLEPAVFWRLTPIELRVMLGLEAAAPGLNRARLEELQAAFPDVRREGGADGQAGNGGSAGDP